MTKKEVLDNLFLLGFGNGKDNANNGVSTDFAKYLGVTNTGFSNAISNEKETILRKLIVNTIKMLLAQKELKELKAEVEGYSKSSCKKVVSASDISKLLGTENFLIEY